MEYLRQCYSTKFRLWVGGVEKIVPARWYWAADDAKVFPGPSAFASNVWAKIGEEDAPGPGEIDRERVYDDGCNPGYLGQCTVGDPEWYATGQLPAGVGTPAVPLPACCGGGFPPIQQLCPQCPDGAPVVWEFVGKGFTGANAPLNGVWELPGGNGCVWQQIKPTASWQLDYFDGTWELGGLTVGGGAVYQFKSPRVWNCRGWNTLYLAFTEAAGGAPPYISVRPFCAGKKRCRKKSEGSA